MEINCIICSDLFTQSSEIVVNQCGHIFHNACLLQWLERSKTCPQCRTRATEKSMYKVYFNFLNTDHITDNIGTLQAKLDGANFKLQLKQQELKNLYSQSDLREAQNVQLRELVADSEKRIRTLESGTNALKEQISFYRNKVKETERLQAEVMTLKSELNNVEKVQTAIYGSRAEVTEILKNETNIEALALLSATLKKTLLDMERKNSLMQNRLKHAQNDINKHKRECISLESENKELRRNLKDSSKSWEEEKHYLRQKIEELNKMLNEKQCQSTLVDTSVHRILMESPAPLPRRKAELKSDDLVVKSSPTVAENVLRIKDSDSPYLPVKSNFSTLLNAKYSSKLSQKKSIFKSPPDLTPLKPSTSKTVYTGLGGQIREDWLKFPKREPAQIGLKRHKSSSAVPTSKFRKLAPGTSSKKITDFMPTD